MVMKNVANRRFPLYRVIDSHYLFSNITPAIINYEGNFARKYFVNF